MSTPWLPYIKRFIQNLSSSFAVLFLLFCLSLGILMLFAYRVLDEKSFAFDMYIFQLVKPYESTAMTGFMKAVTFLGSQDFLLPANIILVVLFLYVKKTRWDALKVTAIILSSRAVLYLLKFIHQRHRPPLPLIEQPDSYSFPSGHSLSGLTYFGMLAYITYKRIENPLLRWIIIILLISLVLLIGFSRIYLRQHFASDVIAGFCLGITWLLLAKWFLYAKQKKATEPVVPGGEIIRG